MLNFAVQNQRDMMLNLLTLFNKNNSSKFWIFQKIVLTLQCQ